MAIWAESFRQRLWQVWDVGAIALYPEIDKSESDSAGDQYWDQWR
ncbi:hypothetical protein [Leptolyngbya sp. O-77]|nr:hypothetical protein [Leptolyngbya sp. O-77]